MAGIFICYRREDSAGHAGRLRDTLAARLPYWEIFRDLEAIGPGEDFVEVMSREIAACDVFLAVIGQRWLTATHPDGRRRLDDPDDHVRRELAEALARGVRIIPVLVAGAAMPRAGELPLPLKPLATRNAITLDDEGWDLDVDRLTAAINPHRAAAADVSGPGRSTTAVPGSWPLLLQRKGRLIAVMAAATVLLIAMVALFNGSPDRPATAQNRSPSRGTEPAGDRGRLEERRAERGPSPADAPASPGTTEDEVQATFLMGSEAELGQAIFEVVDARVLPGPEMALLLRVRVRNETAYDLHLHGGQFRLVQGDDVRPPENFLSEVVPTETAKEATVSFERISAAGDVALRIVHSGETAEIPLDLSGRRGATAAADREARRAGRTTFPVAVDSAFALMRFGDLAAELREATVRRYAHKLTLALTVRVHNRSRYDAAVGDDQFRLVVNGLPRGPVRRFQQIVRSDESGECRVVFDVPFDSPEVVLRTRFREQVAEIPLQIPPAAVPPGRVQRAAGR